MKFGGWWLVKVDALEGEKEVFSLFANRTQSANRAVGGYLFITDRRLIFTPHLIDGLFGGQKRLIPLNEIADVSAQTAGGDSFGGGLRNRLRIDLKDGTVELFVINKLDQIIEKLQAHLGGKNNQTVG